MYDPTIGRWLEEDPIGFAGGDLNLDRYVGNDPTNATDPSGLDAILVSRPQDPIKSGVYWTAGNNKTMIGYIDNRDSGSRVQLFIAFGGENVNLGHLRNIAAAFNFSGMDPTLLRGSVQLVFEDIGHAQEQGRVYGSLNNSSAQEALAELPGQIAQLATHIATELAATFIVPQAASKAFSTFLSVTGRLTRTVYSIVRGKLMKKVAGKALEEVGEAEAQALAKQFNERFGRTLVSVGPLRGKAATQAARDLGYTTRIPAQRAPFDSHGQPVFQQPGGNRYITPDIDGHGGGVWKMFDNNGRRIGTYDINLSRIGD
jgi:hypothetical protein